MIGVGACLAAEAGKAPKWDLEAICFEEQLKFIRDPEPFVTADCSRRAGKTEVCAIDLLDTAKQFDGVDCVYITLTRLNAERLMWRKLKAINEQFALGGLPNEAKLMLTMPNKSVIYLCGAKDKSEIEKFRGMALKLVYLDEIQSMKAFVAELIDDVLGPALADYAGKLKLIGTPAPLQSGVFWEAINSPSYSHHHWTFFNNPFIAQKSGLTHQQVLDRELKRRNVPITHPSVRREWFGEWTIDTEALVIHYSAARNHFDAHGGLTDYVIGVDIGHDDADAIAVIGWHAHHKKCYLVEEFIKAGQGITELADEIEKRYNQYQPLKIVMDTGGLGKKIAVELQKRRSLPITAAEKSRKVEFLALLDDALRTQAFFAKSDSQFAQDSYIVEWDFDKCTPEKKVIKDEPHSDMVDAVLYAFREALHWLAEAPKAKVNIPVKEAWRKHTEEQMNQQLQREVEADQQREQEATNDALMSLDPSDEQGVLRHFLNKRR